MVLPPPAADDPQGPEDPGWAELVARLVGFSERGILILIGGARDAHLRELVLALLPGHPELEVYTDPRPLVDVPEKTTVVLAPGAEHALWLNLNRPLFAKLRVVLWCDVETARVLAREAVDFFDWTSHRVECPEGPPPFVVAGIRASVAARAPGVVWGGERAGFEAALAVAFPPRKVQWLNAETSKEAMVASAGQRGPDWLGFDDAAGGEALGVFQDVLGALHTRGRAVIVSLREAPVGWHPVPEGVAGVASARARLAQAGAANPGRLAALAGLEPEAIELLEGLLRGGVTDAQVEPGLRESEDAGVAIARLAVERGLVDRGAMVPPVLRAFAGDLAVRREHEAAVRPVADEGIREAVADLKGGEQGLEHLYRRTVVDQFEHLTFKGMSRTGRAISLALDKVYVALKAVAEVPEAADTYSADERRILHEAGQLGRTEDDVRMELDSLRFQRWQDESREAGARNVRRSIEDAVADPSQPGVVILGDPGSGKTTLLHYLALRAARGDAPDPATVGSLQVVLRTPANQLRLPIFVPLAAYDDHVRREGSVSLRDFLAVYYDKRLSLPGLEPVFREVLEEGRALVLLDGLDEVLDVGMRIRVANEVRALIQQEAGRGNRFVITSRFVGYREAPLSGLFSISVVPFGKEDIETFARQWCEAYEVWAAEGKRSDVAMRKADGEARALIGDVEANPSVLALAANPMLLTMLALLRRQGGKLPEQRVKLYQQYVETLLDNNWEAARSEGAREVAPERFDQQTATEYLIELSLWLQQNKPSGTASRHDLETALLAIDLKLEGHDPGAPPAKARLEAQRRAGLFLKDMRYLAGLLAERGRDAFGFLHLTFQEYFAGRALARMAPEERWQIIKENLHRPRWREPILLCAGWLGIVETRRKDVGTLARWILDAKSPHEEILHRDLFLASDLAADNVGLDKSVLEEIAVGLIARAESPVATVRQKALTGLAHLARVGNEGALRWLEERIRQKERSHELALAIAPVLGAESCATLREALWLWLGDQEPSFAHAALLALGRLVLTHPPVRERILLELDNKSGHIRQAAIGALAPFLREDHDLQERMLWRMNDVETHVRQAAVRAMGPFVMTSDVARCALIDKLNETDVNVRAATLQALGALFCTDSEVRKVLLEHLVEPWHFMNDALKASTIQGLAPIVSVRPDVSEAIIKSLSLGLNHPSLSCGYAFEALAPLARTDAGLRKMLYDVCRESFDSNPYAFALGLNMLGSLFLVDDGFLDLILPAVNHSDAGVRQASVRALIPLAHIDPNLRLLLQKKIGTETWPVFPNMIRALGGFVCTDAATCSAIIAALGHTAQMVRCEAVRSLSIAVSMVRAARETVVSALQDPDGEVCAGAIQSLAPLAATDASMLRLICSKLHDPSERVQVESVRALAPLANAHRDILGLIRSKLGRSYWPIPLKVAVEVVNAVWPLLSGDSEVRHIAVGILSTEHHISGLSPIILQDLFATDPTAQAIVQNDLRGFNGRWRSTMASNFARCFALCSFSLVPGAVDALVALMDDPDQLLQYHVADALSTVVLANQEVRERLLLRLRDPDENVWLMALRALAPLATKHPEVRRVVLAELKSSNDGRRWSFAQTLQPGVLADTEFRDLAIEWMGRRAEGDRSVAIRLLAPLVDQDRIRHLICERMDDSSRNVQRQMVAALVPTIAHDREVRRRLLPWLGVVNNGGTPALNADDMEKDLRRKLADGYGAILAEEPELLAHVIRMLLSPAWQARTGAAWALSAMPGGPPPEALALLRGLLDDGRGEESWTERVHVASLVINDRLETLSNLAVATLVEALDYAAKPWYLSGSEVRAQAGRALGNLKPVYRNDAIFARLARLLAEDDQPDVRDAAYQALLRLAVAPEPSEVSFDALVELAPPPPSRAMTSTMLPLSTILHLSDLHFGTPENATLWRTQLAEDLREQGVTRLDALILSGDIANRSTLDEYAAAQAFVEALRDELHLSRDQIIAVPGNHDLNWALSEASYTLHKRKNLPSPPAEGTFIQHGPEAVEIRDETLYRRRFDPFAHFYENLRGEPYPLDPAEQGLVYHLPALGLLVLGLNSAWQLDHHFTARASIHPAALSRALDRIRNMPELKACPLKLAVWHHPIHSASDDRITDPSFLQQLAKAGFRLALHGHIHKAELNDFHYDKTPEGRRLDLVCAGTFGAPVREWVPGYPLQYNLLRFEGRTLTVGTRRREELNGAWSPDARWLQGTGKDPLPRYTVNLFPGP